MRSVAALPRDVDRKNADALGRVCLQHQLYRHPDLAILFRMTRASRVIWANRCSYDDDYDGEDDHPGEQCATLRLVTDRDRDSCAALMDVLRFDYDADKLHVEHAPSFDLDVVRPCKKWFAHICYTLLDG